MHRDVIILKRLTIGDRAFDIANTTILTIILFIVVAPLLFILAASMSNPDDVLLGNVWFWPVGLNISAYEQIFAHEAIMTGYRNTIFYTVAGTILNLVLTICAAYPLSRRDLRGRNAIMMLMLFTMYFSGGLIPQFMNVRNLGLYDTWWVLLLLPAISTYNVIIMKTFFQNSIPQEINDAAIIDGCTNTRLLLGIILPLSKAVISVLLLWYAVAHWNSYFNALLYLRDKNKFPLQLVLRDVLVLSRPLDMGTTADELQTYAEQIKRAELLKYAIIVAANLPLLMIYPFIQKYFAQGIMIGSVKG